MQSVCCYLTGFAAKVCTWWDIFNSSANSTWWGAKKWGRGRSYERIENNLRATIAKRGDSDHVTSVGECCVRIICPC